MSITLIKSTFTFPELGESYEEKIEVLDNYFDREFTNQFFEFANAVIGKIAARINECHRRSIIDLNRRKN